MQSDLMWELSQIGKYIERREDSNATLQQISGTETLIFQKMVHIRLHEILEQCIPDTKRRSIIPVLSAIQSEYR